MNSFLRKNKKKNIVILDIPLLLENKINRKNDILVFVQSKKLDILKRLKKRKNYNPNLLSKFKKIQLSLDYKKKKSQFVIKNNFTKKSVKVGIKKIITEIL
jgi:dephospho-CoA kinase